jgi:hypothetical protein
MRRRRRVIGRGSGGPNWVEKAGLAAAVVGVLVAIVAIVVSSGSGGGESSNAAEAARPGKLDVVDVHARDVLRFGRKRAFLEVALHNQGARLVVVDGAEVEVRRVYKLSRCAAQDDLPVSNVYGLKLPTTAHKGEVFETPLHQQIGPDEADRFRIQLSTKPPARDLASLYLFEIEVSLKNDGPQPELPLGTAVLALPKLPSAGEYYWDSGTPKVLHNFVLYEPEYARYLRRDAMPCWRSNTAALEAVGKGMKDRSGNLEKIIHGLIEPSAGALE